MFSRLFGRGATLAQGCPSTQWRSMAAAGVFAGEGAADRRAEVQVAALRAQAGGIALLRHWLGRA